MDGRDAEADAAIIAVMRELHRRGFVAGSVGNASVRRGAGCRITPSRLAYARMRCDDLVTVDADGEVVEGRREPSSELALHLQIYRARADIAAIVHTHSPNATAWSFLAEPLEPRLEETEYFAIGPVRTAPPRPRGTAELGRSAAATLAGSAAVLLARHGVVTVGRDLAHALAVAEAVEHQAQVAWLLRAPRSGPTHHAAIAGS